MRYAQEPSRVRHLLVLAAAAAALVALVALVVFGITIATGHEEDQSSSMSTTGAGDSTGSAEDPAGAGQWETDTDTGLPIAATFHDGHPVGFPSTDAGAAAMVVELNRAQIGLDYDDAVTTIRTYAAEDGQAFFDDLATAAIAERRERLGVPVRDDGGAGRRGSSVLAPAGYAQTPIGYQVEEYGPDRYLASVINDVTATTANGHIERSTYVGQQLVAWNPDADRGGVAGDWELIEPGTEDRDRFLATDPPAAAPLGTPEFERAGWAPLLESSTNRSSSGAADQGADEQ